jgi:DNA-binding LacI/PurR family transcriptional regulator
MRSGKTTSFDIAHRAGVSQATVSRALRDSPLVNEETRRRIQQIAREMNYHVDRRAAGLRSQRTHTLALLVHEDPTSDDSQINPFFLTMLGNITRVAAARNYDVLLSFQQLSDDWLSEYQISNRADGIILLGYGDYGSIASKLQRMREEGAHFTIWGATLPELEGHAVGCDNREGGAIAARHLLALGRRRIAFLGSPTSSNPEFKLRYRGCCEEIEAAGLRVDPALQIDSLLQETSGYEAARKLLASGVDFDAIFAASDLIAFGAMNCLGKHGIAVPEQVSVVGFDDVPAASYFTPALTTVRQDTLRAAEGLVDGLLHMIDGERVVSMLLPPSLIIRDSCGSSAR